MATVNLISFTQPAPGWVNAEEINNLQEIVAYCARVSNPDNQLNTETSGRLMDYLIAHRHWSPFEMVNVCLEVITTRDIARQLLRHRSFSFQEFSQRYATVNDAGSNVDYRIRECRLQDTRNRQNSLDINPDDIEQQYLAHQWEKRQKELAAYCDDVYSWAIKNGIAKEVARAVLPEGLTTSRLYVNGTLRSWIHYLEVRLDVGTQREHRELAQACALEIAKIFPRLAQDRE